MASVEQTAINQGHQYAELEQGVKQIVQPHGKLGTSQDGHHQYAQLESDNSHAYLIPEPRTSGRQHHLQFAQRERGTKGVEQLTQSAKMQQDHAYAELEKGETEMCVLSSEEAVYSKVNKNN